DSQSESNNTPINAGFYADICEMVSVISQEFVASQRIALFTLILAQVEAADCLIGIVQDVQIKITVPVVIEKCGVRGVSFVRDAILRGLIFEREITAIDKQFVAFIKTAFHIPGIADINIQQAIAVDVCKRYSCRPGLSSRYACFFGNVFKTKVALVEKQFIRNQVSCKIYID